MQNINISGRTRNTVRQTAYNVAQLKIGKRPYLPKKLWDSANKQKQMWLKAVDEESKLNRTEEAVLRVIAYSTDENGSGTPSLGYIAEKAKVSYSTALRATKSLKNKHIIQTTRRGYKLTNTYDLIGFNFKLENCSLKMTDNITLSPPPKGEGGEREVNNIYTHKQNPPPTRKRSSDFVQKSKPEEKKPHFNDGKTYVCDYEPPKFEPTPMPEHLRASVMATLRGDYESPLESISVAFSDEELMVAKMQYEKLGIAASESMIISRATSNRKMRGMT